MIKWFIFLLLCFPMHILAQDIEQLKVEIEKILTYDAEVDIASIPHLMVGIAIEDQRYYMDFGRDQASSPIDSSTLFEIGDLTKVFTARLCLELVENGLMVLDSSLNAYLPVEHQDEYFQFINIKQMLMHRSGLPKLPSDIGLKEVDDYGLFANYTSEDLIQNVQSVKKEAAGDFKYSNVGYALLEHAIEAVSRNNFGEELYQRVLYPHEMLHSSVASSTSGSSKLLKGHNLANVQIPHSRYQSFAASQGMISSAEDLLKYASQSWQSPTKAYKMSISEFTKIRFEKNLDIGYGWHRVNNKKYSPFYLHTGKTGGFRSYLAMVPETKTAVVVLSNSKLPQKGLGYYILKMINFGWKYPKGKKK